MNFGGTCSKIYAFSEQKNSCSNAKFYEFMS